MDQPRIDRESVEVEAHQVTVDRETHPRHLATDNGQRGVKSRSPHSNDNTRAEAKNEVVIRQNFGYVHIPQKHAAPINTLCANHLAPHLNLHRPCLLPKRTPDAKGKVRVTYPLERVQISLRSCKPCPSQAATCSAASPSTASPPKLGPPAIVPPLRNSRRLAQASFQPSLDGLPPKSPDA
ncbi:MAG TPA: hypothetical protein VFQ88_03810 [Nevskiaceae bacterium]|nr:hypothetical protein [Nevskiaceae bacterium]